MSGVWVAKMETEHYTWIAVGNTEDEAINAIVDAWQNGPGYEDRLTMTREELEEWYGINYDYYECGKCQWR